MLKIATVNVSFANLFSKYVRKLNTLNYIFLVFKTFDILKDEEQRKERPRKCVNGHHF